MAARYTSPGLKYTRFCHVVLKKFDVIRTKFKDVKCTLSLSAEKIVVAGEHGDQFFATRLWLADQDHARLVGIPISNGRASRPVKTRFLDRVNGPVP
jgi:hypothetical protein